MSKETQVLNNLEYTTYRTRKVVGQHNYAKNTDIITTIYDLEHINEDAIKGIQLKLMQSNKTGKRSVMFKLLGGKGYEHGFWFNIFAPKPKKRKLKSGVESTTYLTWGNCTPRHLDSTFRHECFNDDHDSIVRFGSDIMDKFDNSFGKNKYSAVPWGSEGYLGTPICPIPYCAIAVSELGKGDEFHLVIGKFEIRGKFSDFEDFKGSFGSSDKSLARCIGQFMWPRNDDLL